MPVVDRLGEAVGVPLGREVALELRDEQPAVGEDQDAEVPCGFDEPGGGDRLAGRGRVAEAVAPRGARVLAAEHRLVDLVVDDARVDVVVLVVEVRRRRRSTASAPLPFPFPFSSVSRWFDAISSVNMPASASTWWRRSSVPAAVAGVGAASTRSRPEHEAVANAPPRRGRAATGVHFGDGVVERTAARGARRQRGGGVLTGVQERLAVPGLSAERGGFQALRRLRRRMCRVEVGLVHMRSTRLECCIP